MGAFALVELVYEGCLDNLGLLSCSGRTSRMSSSSIHVLAMSVMLRIAVPVAIGAADGRTHRSGQLRLADIHGLRCSRYGGRW